jgi:ribosomal protein S18 acetylase RimI-like enzyme
LCFWKGTLVGFVTLTTDTIGYNLVEQCDGIDGYAYQKYPAIKIARLAVDDRYKRRGIGENLLLWAVGKAYEISNQIGCRYITVDAKRESINFYTKYEFKIIKKHKEDSYLPRLRGSFFKMRSIANLLMPISLRIALIFYHSSIASARLNNFGIFQSA